MKREETLLKLLCVIVAAGFFALIAYNFVAGGSIISTDGLFFTVVPMVLALSFLLVPAMGAVSRRMEKRASAGAGSAPQLAAAGGHTLPAGGRTTAPALKDARGRAMPPDVNRMVAEMNAPRSKES
jgi:Zn-dependent protease with chaperone function